MDVLEFTKRMGEVKADPAVDRLAERVQEDLATFAVHLARYADALPEGLRSEYIVLLRTTLAAVPTWTTIWVTPSLFESLQRVVTNNGDAELLARVRSRE